MLKLRSISTKLLLSSFLIVGTSLAILNVVWITHSITARNLDNSELQVSVAYRAADNIQSYIFSRQSEIKYLTEVEDFISLPPEKKQDLLNLILKSDSALEEIDFLDASGQEIIKTSRLHFFKPDEYINKSQTDQFSVAASGQIYISPVFFENAVPHLTLALPVYDASKDLAGVLKTDLSLSNLWSSLESIKPSAKGYAYVVGQNGILIAHPDFSQVLKNQNVASRNCVNKVLAHSQVCTGLDSSDGYINESGISAFAAGVPLKSLGWAVMVESPLAEIQSSIYQSVRFSVIVILTTLFWTVVISIWFSRKITTPIKDLDSGAGLIGQGNLDYRLSIHTGDEIEQVANSFNQMASKLNNSYTNLEGKVAQRTKDLQLRTEEANAERNKLAVILQGITDGVFALDSNKRFILFNQAAQAMTGFNAQEVLGKHFDETFKLFADKTPITSREICPVLTQINEDRIVFNKQGARLINKEGREVFINIISAVIKEGNHTGLGCIVTIHNISKEQELEAMKLDFVSMAAHELRTPLTSIRGYLSVFLNENKGKFTGEQNMFLNRINISAQQLMALVENLLSVSRIERGVLTINFASVDWIALIKQIVPDFSERAKEKNIALTFQEPTQPIPNIQADKLRITEVLTNLISNALNYTPAGGSVTIWVEQTGGEVVTRIKDTGQGIPKEAIPHLFTKFFRVSGKLEQGSKGTGLGLYISKSIIDMHHGRIWVQSELGKGSIFSFSIPVQTLQTPPEPPKEVKIV